MGIHKQIAKLIVAEHAQRPIKGRILLIGRQTISPSEAEIRKYLAEFGIPARNISVEADRDTRYADAGSISDRTFFALFTDASFSALDVTDYEKADVVHDMNEPVPDHLHGQFDFIYNGSCLDNMFNPAVFLRNCSELLAPGGRIVHIEHASLWRGAYLMYSGDWFNDYYAINDFADCEVFYGKFRFDHNKERWKLSRLKPLESYSWSSSAWPHVIICVAEKGAQSTSGKYPIQAQYRPEEHKALYSRALERFAANERYPRGFGAPTTHRPRLKKILRHFIKFVVTRSNLKPIQNL